MSLFLQDGTEVTHRIPVIYQGMAGLYEATLVGVKGNGFLVINFKTRVHPEAKIRVIDGITYENTWVCTPDQLRKA